MGMGPGGGIEHPGLPPEPKRKLFMGGCHLTSCAISLIIMTVAICLFEEVGSFLLDNSAMEVIVAALEACSNPRFTVHKLPFVKT